MCLGACNGLRGHFMFVFCSANRHKTPAHSTNRLGETTFRGGMRFLMLNWRDPVNPRSGGAERVTHAYLSDLARRGHEVYWFAPMFPDGQAEEDLDGIRIVREGQIGWSIAAARRWCQAQAPFDLVMDQHHGIPWYAPWWCKTRCVAYIHEVLGPIWNAFYKWPYSMIGRHQERLTQKLYRNVPFWTASSFTRDKLLEVGVKEVTLIPYGVDTQAIERLEVKHLRPPLRLVTVSRLAPNKRVDHAIRTMDWLLKNDVDCEMTVVGTGEVEGAMRTLAADLGLEDKVRFTGAVSEEAKDKILRESHWLLHTSMREGWGLNVIEANAMGTPAAVYPVAGLVESTLHDQTGLISSAETPEALGTCIRNTMRTPEKYQRYRVAAWERAKTYHWSQVLPIASAWLEEQAQVPRE